MSEMETPTTRRFLVAYAGIETRLRRIVRSDRRMMFGDLVTEAARIHAAVRAYATDLKEYGDLRNAIVHERGDGRAIAEPYEGTVRRLEAIRTLLDTPALALTVVRVPRVETCGPRDSVGAVAGRMLNGSFSQLPVYDEGRFLALLTAETIARWLGSRLASGIGLIAEESVGSILPFAENADNHRLLPRTATVYQALELFDRYARDGKSLDALLITHEGKDTDKPLSIVTTFDIPTLVAATVA